MTPCAGGSRFELMGWQRDLAIARFLAATKQPARVAAARWAGLASLIPALNRREAQGRADSAGGADDRRLTGAGPHEVGLPLIAVPSPARPSPATYRPACPPAPPRPGRANPRAASRAATP